MSYLAIMMARRQLVEGMKLVPADRAVPFLGALGREGGSEKTLSLRCGLRGFKWSEKR
jgi:hypothetical protein